MAAKPSIVFLSGGTAINALAKVLTTVDVHVAYLITTFDSGGSSAALRKAFSMPAVGDLRSRMVAIAAEDVGSQTIARLLGTRFDKSQTTAYLEHTLGDIIDGVHPLISHIPSAIQQEIARYLCVFQQEKPDDFPLQGASIGNLVLSGIYLDNNRCIETAIDYFRRWLKIEADVVPITTSSAHLHVELVDGTQISGQHAFTGKEATPIHSPIKHMSLMCEYACDGVAATPKALECTSKADLICYPPGSFYSSVLANLLPSGILEAISANPCQKVYVPNLGEDPEQLGLCICQQLAKFEGLAKGSGYPQVTDVIIDQNDEREKELITIPHINTQTAPLMTQTAPDRYDPNDLAKALLSRLRQ